MGLDWCLPVCLCTERETTPMVRLWEILYVAVVLEYIQAFEFFLNFLFLSAIFFRKPPKKQKSKGLKMAQTILIKNISGL